MNDYSRDIEKYLKGELTPSERNALERKALHDPFLADALEGAEGVKPTEFANDLEELKTKIGSAKATRTWQLPMRIAAGIAILAVSSWLVWRVLDSELQPPQLALEKNEPTPALTTPTDSIVLGEAASEQPETKPALTPPPVERDVASVSSGRAKAATKAPETVAELKNEPAPVIAENTAGEAEAGKSKAEEIKITESVAAAEAIGKEAEASRAMTDDVQKDKLAKTETRKKAVTAAPAAAEKRDAGVLSHVFRGRVTSAEDGLPLPGVNVTIKNSQTGTATDGDGNYQIATEQQNPTLVYSFIGLNSKEVKAEKQEVNVQLTADNTQLSEVVVVGYGAEKGESLPPTIEFAHPENGNRSFKQYLEKNIRYPEQAKLKNVEGRVTVEFTIEPNGTLSNFNVIKGIGSGCDEELIRLIKEGPKWIPTKKNHVSVPDKAKVRLKFELPK